MSNEERNTWWTLLVGLLSLFLSAFLINSLVPEHRRDGDMQGIAFLCLGLLATYLLILSWRAAYLSGRKSTTRGAGQ